MYIYIQISSKGVKATQGYRIESRISEVLSRESGSDPFQFKGSNMQEDIR